MGGKMAIVTDFIFLGSKITEDGGCSQEIWRWLLLVRKAGTNLDSVLKSKDITLPTKVHIVKAMVFLVVMDDCESWTIKKAEHWRIDAFELWCWRRLESPLESKEIKPVNLKENQPWILWKDWCWSWSSSNWASYVNSQLIGKVPDAGKVWGQKEKRASEDRWLDGHELGQIRGDSEG